MESFQSKKCGKCRFSQNEQVYLKDEQVFLSGTETSYEHFDARDWTAVISCIDQDAFCSPKLHNLLKLIKFFSSHIFFWVRNLQKNQQIFNFERERKGSPSSNACILMVPRLQSWENPVVFGREWIENKPAQMSRFNRWTLLHLYIEKNTKMI